jgi:hypothetical protein
MCNIARYVGENRAAPILLDMIRRQQGFDGGSSTGIATIYEGKIDYRKVIGDVDVLMRTTDALNLPGNIGFAHSRPGGTPETMSAAHPFVTMDETMAGVTNCTGRGMTPKNAVEILKDMLEDNNYQFRGEMFVDDPFLRLLKNGSRISSVEVRLNAVHHYHKHLGMSISAAMARVDSEAYRDGVLGILSLDTPDRLYFLRTTRPLTTLKAEDGMYMASCRFAFPEDKEGAVRQLPLMHPCEIFKDKIVVSEEKIQGEEVSEITEYTFDEGYKRISELLSGKEDAPLHFDDLESFFWEDSRDIFEGDHTLIQDARLVYDVLWKLHEEGKLHIKYVLFNKGNTYEPSDPMYNDARNIPGVRNRIFMWLD